MRTRFAATASILALLAMVPTAGLAATLTVDGTTYQTLSAAVAAAQAADDGPHVINVTVDQLPTADGGQIVISEPMTINGDADGNGTKCDILVDMTGIQAAVDVGFVDVKCYIEVQAASAVTINDLKIHPNADCTAATTGASVDGIRLYEPATTGQNGTYVLNRVWVSGSDASNNYVDLATSQLIHATTTKKWSLATGTGTVASATNAVIQIQNNGAGTCDVELNNCMAGLGESNALNIAARGGSTKITGGLYGHVSRDGIRIIGNGVTLTGSPTNRLRVVRSTCSSGGDGHAIEIYATGAGNSATVNLMEYVDVAGMNTSQLFKIWGDGIQARVIKMQYCRGLGKLSLSVGGVANNPAVLLKNMGRLDEMRNCTIVGAAGSVSQKNPLATDTDTASDINIFDCIFTSEDSGVINAVNTDTVGGIKTMANCAIPNDLYTSESLASVPITGTGFTPAHFVPTNSVNASPHYLQMLADYDWSEAAVSVNGSNLLAGNPNVLRPSDAAYLGAASDGSNLTGGAGWTVRSGPPTVTNATFISPNVLEVTFSETMGTYALEPVMYTLADAPQRGTLAAQPDSVSWISATKYRLTWNTGARAGGQFQLDVDQNIADTTGETLGVSTVVTVPVTVSGLSLD